MVRRLLIFNTVGVIGFVLQTLLVWTLVGIAGLDPVVATVTAIELTVLHNFVWHLRWTWRDRPSSGRETLERLLRFNLSNGGVSLVGGAALVWLGTRHLHLHYLLANVAAVGLCALVNFAASELWAFRRARTKAARPREVGPCRVALVTLVALGALVSVARGAELTPETQRAFDRYIREVEAGLEARERGSGAFLWIDESAARRGRVRGGEVVVGSLTADGPREILGGLVHDWIGAAWMPGVTLEATLALICDVDQHARVYAPEVVRSKLLGQNGDELRSYLRLLKHKVITVVLDTEHVARLSRLGPGRARSWSRSVRITEVQHAGSPDEKALPQGEGHGFLWALNSYWRFEERDGGVYVECRAVSLTRQIPTGLGWLIGPIVSGLPRESLINTLAATRAGVAGRSGH